MNEDNFYDSLSSYYDKLQEDINPCSWAKKIHELATSYCKAVGDGENGSRILCDLGCGDGRIDIELRKYGYEIIGIDSSLEMLSKARNLAPDILWLCQDITDYDLYGTCDVFVSLLDTMNHLLDENDVVKVFKSFKNFMSDGGIFIFDIGTREHFEETLGNNVFFQDYDDFTLLWDNEYDADTMMNVASLTLFERIEEDSYSRCDGVIEEKYYDKARLVELANECGLVLLHDEAYDSEREFLIFGKK